jgi:hypothetical protein
VNERRAEAGLQPTVRLRDKRGQEERNAGLQPSMAEVSGRRGLGGGSGVVVGEVAGQLAVGVDLGEQILRLLLDSGDRVGASREA